MAIVGSEEEYKRVFGLIKESSVKSNFIGFVNSENTEHRIQNTESFLGKFSQLNEIIDIYKIDEVIFCAKNVSSEKIIDAMAESEIEFKIAPQGSSSIIGSNSIDTAGDLYSIDVNSVNKPSNQRKKRIIDTSLSAILLILSPLLVFVIKHPINYLLNCFKVLLGFNTWVGEAAPTLKGEIQNYSKRKFGILNPTDGIKNSPLGVGGKITPEMSERLNKIYAKDYSVRNDINIVLKGIRKLGR